MRIPRIRILRHWTRAEIAICPPMRGMWLLLIEPRWPIVRFHKTGGEYEDGRFFGAEDRDSLDIVIEHFDRTKWYGDCKEKLWHVDLFDYVNKKR